MLGGAWDKAIIPIISSHPNFSLLLFFPINLHGLDFFFFSLLLLSRVRCFVVCHNLKSVNNYHYDEHIKFFHHLPLLVL